MELEKELGFSEISGLNHRRINDGCQLGNAKGLAVQPCQPCVAGPMRTFCEPSDCQQQTGSFGTLRRSYAAGLNRRMRKTACPVVWEGDRAQFQSLDPIWC